MTTLALRFISQGNTGTRVHNSGLLHDETISLEALNVATAIGQGNFVDFVGVQPNLALSALEDGSGEALLQTKIDCHFE